MTEYEQALINIIRSRPDLLEEAITLVTAELQKLDDLLATDETNQ